MNHKIIPEKKKLTVRFKKSKKGKINKSIICHLAHYLSLYYGKLEMGECSEYIEITLTVPKRKIENEREILNSAKTFLKDFFRLHAGNVCNCNKCQQKRRPVFCSRNRQNKAVA